MKKQSNFYYVLVFTSTGPVYVTSVGEHKVAYWNRLEKPMQMSDKYAESMMYGLCLNGNNAVVIKSPFEIETQPYYYEKGEFEWRVTE